MGMEGFTLIEDGDGSGITWLRRESDGATVAYYQTERLFQYRVWRADMVGGRSLTRAYEAYTRAERNRLLTLV